MRADKQNGEAVRHFCAERRFFNSHHPRYMCGFLDGGPERDGLRAMLSWDARRRRRMIAPWGALA